METKICPTCKGEGTYSIDIGTHNSDYETKDCTRCGKSGKIITSEIHLTIEVPFPKGKNDIYVWDHAVHIASRKTLKDLKIT